VLIFTADFHEFLTGLSAFILALFAPIPNEKYSGLVLILIIEVLAQVS